MKWIVFAGTMVLVSLFFWYQINNTGNIPKIGQAAPSFSLPDQDGKMHSLAEYRGKWLVLYFYPKDDTPICTKEACAFRDDFSKINAAGANLLGVSLDSEASHAKFAKKNRLPFPLLADTSGKVTQEYGILENLILFRIAKRNTFLIDPKGNVAKIYSNVQVYAHVNEILNDLKRLSAG